MKNEISVYVADVSPLASPLLFERVYHSVSETRQRKTDRMKNPGDKRLSLGAEYLLMSALRDYGLDYGKEKILINENGKP